MASNITEYVDLDALAIWKERLNGINTNCIEYLDSFEKLCLELSSVWSGDAANGFDENFKDQLANARDHHSELTDVNKFIETVSETVLNQ